MLFLIREKFYLKLADARGSPQTLMPGLSHCGHRRSQSRNGRLDIVFASQRLVRQLDHARRRLFNGAKMDLDNQLAQV